MTKIVPCPDCDGRGYFSIQGDNAAWSLTCDRCGGLGTIEVPVTNSDRIRGMSDDEWAASEHMPCPYIHDMYDECKFGWHTQTQTCDECKLEWLQSPATK